LEDGLDLGRVDWDRDPKRAGELPGEALATMNFRLLVGGGFLAGARQAKLVCGHLDLEILTSESRELGFDPKAAVVLTYVPRGEHLELALECGENVFEPEEVLQESIDVRGRIQQWNERADLRHQHFSSSLSGMLPVLGKLSGRRSAGVVPRGIRLISHYKTKVSESVAPWVARRAVKMTYFDDKVLPSIRSKCQLFSPAGFGSPERPK